MSSRKNKTAMLTWVEHKLVDNLFGLNYALTLVENEIDRLQVDYLTNTGPAMTGVEFTNRKDGMIRVRDMLQRLVERAEASKKLIPAPVPQGETNAVAE